MGKRGPPKTPTAQLSARGSWRANERNDAEMPEGIPEPPDWLNGEARKQWFALIPLLSTARLVRQTDRNSLARYCTMVARWREVEDEIDKDAKDAKSLLVLSGEGYKAHPLLAVSVRLGEALGRLEDRFGLSPSARASVGGAADKKPPTVKGKGRFFGSGA